MGTTGDVKKASPKSKKAGTEKENVESEDDGEADEDVGTCKKGKRDKEEHDEGASFPSLSTLNYGIFTECPSRRRSKRCRGPQSSRTATQVAEDVFDQ